MIELFKAADKYDVLGLVQECVASFRQLTGAHEVAPLLQACSACSNPLLIPKCLETPLLPRCRFWFRGRTGIGLGPNEVEFCNVFPRTAPPANPL